MARLLDGRITTAYAFSTVPAVKSWDLPDLERVAYSSDGSGHSFSSVASSTKKHSRSQVARDEPCFITKRPSYALNRVYWIRPSRRGPEVRNEIVSRLKKLKLVRLNFQLNDESNITNLDPMLHACIDKYAFCAVTCSLNTLNELINLFETENRLEQDAIKLRNVKKRYINLKTPPFLNAQYELVVLHPDYMLPLGSDLTVYSTDTNEDGHLSKKSYVIAADGTLRESPGDVATCPRLPTFSFDTVRPIPLNPLLVILNAHIKFKRYFKSPPPKKPLHHDVLELMRKTCSLVDLMYWEPDCVIRNRERDKAWEAGLQPTDSEEEDSHSDDMESDVGPPPPEDATAEEKREYFMSLMSGRDLRITAEDREFIRTLNSPEHRRPSVAGMDPVERVTEWQEAVSVPSLPSEANDEAALS